MTAAPVPQVTVLLDPLDDITVTGTLLARHDPAAGVIIVHPTPGRTAESTLALDLLDAAGHPMGRLSDQRIGGLELLWAAVTAWCDGVAVAHLVVLRAHLLSARQHERLLALWRTLGMDLTLVWHTDGSPARLVLDGMSYRVTHRLADVTDRLATAAPDAPAAAGFDARPLPPLPNVEAGLFRAAAREQLPRVEFDRVAGLYGHGRAFVCRWLADCDAPELDHRAPIAGNAVVQPSRLSVMLTALVAESPTGRHTLALLRGAQHGFTLHGYRLALPPQLPHMVGPGLTTGPFTAETASRIRERIVHPVRAGALATALLTGVGYGTLVSIPLAALGDRADVLLLESRSRAEGGVYAIPASARPLLVAARTFQAVRGAEPHHALFRGGLGGKGRFVRESAEACGLTLPPRHRWDAQWLSTVTAHPYDGPDR